MKTEIDEDLLPESNPYRLTALDLAGLQSVRMQHDGKRVWFFFPRKKAEKVLMDYESGKLMGSLRDFASTLDRTKDRLFGYDRSVRLRGNSDAYITSAR